MSSSWIRKERRFAIYRRDNYKCVYCGKKYTKDQLSIDHVKPRSIGGTNRNENLVTSCVYCNLQKGDKTYRCYLKWIRLNFDDELALAIRNRVYNAVNRKLRWA